MEQNLLCLPLKLFDASYQMICNIYDGVGSIDSFIACIHSSGSGHQSTPFHFMSAEVLQAWRKQARPKHLALKR